MNIEFKQRYKHKKTGKTYLAYDPNIINATNANDQQILILYTNGTKIFVREYNEFHEKFELINKWYCVHAQFGAGASSKSVDTF